MRYCIALFALAVLTQYRRVTDKHTHTHAKTDRHMTKAYYIMLA